MFNRFRDQVTSNFAKLSQSTLFYVSIDRDKVFEVYLSGFPEGERQEHNCNCCKSFLRQWGGIVGIINNEVVTIWDGVDAQGYEEAAKNLGDYIKSLPITDVFLNGAAVAGTWKNLDRKRNVVWEHFALSLPRNLVVGDRVASLQGSKREDFQVFKRGLDELTIEATETVLELIDQGSLYRGAEHKASLTCFLGSQKRYNGIANTQHRENFAWATSGSQSAAASRIRNTAIGTLLIDISGGMDLDDAVTKFEKMVAPTNYKRPTAAVTPKMVAAAKETLKELGLGSALERRFAQLRDVSANDALFVYRRLSVGDIFDEVAKDAIVSPKSFSKVEEVTISNFLEKILPRAKAVDLLLESHHTGGFTTLLTAVDEKAPTIFKWSNPFSWSYTGGLTDKIKERVKAAGGNTEDKLRVSLSWSNYDDLDLHVVEPSGFEIYFPMSSRRSASGGHLDVDMNAGSGTTRTPVENVTWAAPPIGKYKVKIDNYHQRETTNIGFTVQIEFAGQIFDFQYGKNVNTSIEFEVSADNIKFADGTTSRLVSKEKWGLKTNQFHRVNLVTLSPNYWGQNATGNKQFFFFLDGAIADEDPRPIYNEFLAQDLDKHRKVFELVGGRLKVPACREQLSGIGFSETQRSHAYLRIDGSFKRIVKVNF